MQQNAAYNVHAQDTSAHGVLARLIDALQLGQESAPYKSALYSVAGNKLIVQGSEFVDAALLNPMGKVTRFFFCTHEPPDTFLFANPYFQIISHCCALFPQAYLNTDACNHTEPL